MAQSDFSPSATADSKSDTIKAVFSSCLQLPGGEGGGIHVAKGCLQTATGRKLESSDFTTRHFSGRIVRMLAFRWLTGLRLVGKELVFSTCLGLFWPMALTDLHKALLREVYPCTLCRSFGFEGPAANEPYFKFPPTIGAEGEAPLLFVGINPRRLPGNRYPGNQDLHDRLMKSKSAFANLAQNWNGGNRYIAPGCAEKFYHPQMKVVQLLFGKDAKFEKHAAATELFFCATPHAKNLPIEESPCADLYFERVFLKVRPIVVLCVWQSVLRYFQRRAGALNQNGFLLTIGGHSALVMHLPR
jgi:hypothetical protein